VASYDMVCDMTSRAVDRASHLDHSFDKERDNGNPEDDDHDA